MISRFIKRRLPDLSKMLMYTLILCTFMYGCKIGHAQQVKQQPVSDNLFQEKEFNTGVKNKAYSCFDCEQPAEGKTESNIKISDEHCKTEIDKGIFCPPLKVVEHPKTPEQETVEVEEEAEKYSLPSQIYQRSLKGLEEMMEHVEKSKAKVFEKLGGVMDQVAQSRDQMMKGFDNVVGKVSESVTESRVRVIKSFDSMMDKMSQSKALMMEEIDHVIEEIRALPGELRESFVLSVRNRSYIAAGIMVAITAAILIGGAMYFAWCHHDAWSWSYHVGPLEEQSHQIGEGVASFGTEIGSKMILDTVSNGKTPSNGCTVVKRKVIDPQEKSSTYKNTFHHKASDMGTMEVMQTKGNDENQQPSQRSVLCADAIVSCKPSVAQDDSLETHAVPGINQSVTVYKNDIHESELSKSKHTTEVYEGKSSDSANTKSELNLQERYLEQASVSAGFSYLESAILHHLSDDQPLNERNATSLKESSIQSDWTHVEDGSCPLQKDSQLGPSERICAHLIKGGGDQECGEGLPALDVYVGKTSKNMQ